MLRSSWLYPFTYALHLAEEYLAAGGFPAWARWTLELQISDLEFVGWNAFAMGLTTIAVFLLGRNRRRFAFIEIALASSILANAIAHVIASAVTASYSPGLMTGIAVWGPFGTLRLRHLLRTSSRRAVWAGGCIGVFTVVVSATVLVL